MKTNFTIDGVQIKRPHKFTKKRYKITKSERVANGDMFSDYINRKTRYELVWDSIEQKDLNIILDLIWENTTIFFTLEYVENNETKSCTVYAGEIPSDLVRTDDANWIWRDVAINFIEK